MCQGVKMFPWCPCFLLILSPGQLTGNLECTEAPIPHVSPQNSWNPQSRVPSQGKNPVSHATSRRSRHGGGPLMLAVQPCGGALPFLLRREQRRVRRLLRRSGGLARKAAARRSVFLADASQQVDAPVSTCKASRLPAPKGQNSTSFQESHVRVANGHPIQ